MMGLCEDTLVHSKLIRVLSVALRPHLPAKSEPSWKKPKSEVTTRQHHSVQQWALVEMPLVFVAQEAGAVAELRGAQVARCELAQLDSGP